MPPWYNCSSFHQECHKLWKWIWECNGICGETTDARFWDSMVSVVYTGLEHMLSHYEPGGFPRIWTASAFSPSLWRHRMMVHGTVGERCILPVSCSGMPLTKFYSLCGVILNQSTEAKYLGVSLSCDMEWAKHIQEVTSSCSRTVGLLHCNLSSFPIKLRQKAYMSLIIWDLVSITQSLFGTLHLKKHINSPEAAQRKAAPFTTQDFSRTSNVSRMLEDLGWLTLKERCRLSSYFSKSLRARWRFLWRTFSRGQTPGPEVATTRNSEN